MPYAQGLPFAAGSHESYQAAVKASVRRGEKSKAYLRFLYRAGPRSDHEARAVLQLPLSSICSIRNALMHAGLVERSDQTRPSPYGLACRRWQLSEMGHAAVSRMREQP